MRRYVTDALPALFVSILLFVCPAEKPDWMCFRAYTVKHQHFIIKLFYAMPVESC